jgi:hypothetical protein
VSVTLGEYDCNDNVTLVECYYYFCNATPITYAVLPYRKIFEIRREITDYINSKVYDLLLRLN